MNSYDFSLRVSGVSRERFAAFAEALFSPDVACTPSYSGGVATVDFTSEAPSLREAVRGAITHVLKAEPAARIVGVETEGEASLADAFAA